MNDVNRALLLDMLISRAATQLSEAKKHPIVQNEAYWQGALDALREIEATWERGEASRWGL